MTTLLLPLFFLACGDKEEEHEDPALHACEELGGGESITASADPESAPALHHGEGHTVALTSGEVGYVAIEADEAGEMLLFADTSDVVTGLWFNGAELTLPEGSPNSDCPTEIPDHYDLDFEEVGTYVIQLGPAVVDSVWLMVSEGGHAHEE